MCKLLKNNAVSCMSGGYKTIFTQGVLAAFEDNEFIAEAYAGCSSSALIASYAAFGKIREFDISLWTDGLKISKIEGNSQSNAIIHSITKTFPVIRKELWLPVARRLLIATSYVKTGEAESITQTEKAKRFGQKLLIEASRNITTWKDDNLELHLYDTGKDDRTKLLTPENFEAVAYATTRMLHAWHIPAYIEGKAYIDGSYTSLCPAVPLKNLGYQYIICILTEHDNKKTDIFSADEIPSAIDNCKIDFIRPDVNLKEMGVDYYAATEESLQKVYRYGYEKGLEFLKLKI